MPAIVRVVGMRIKVKEQGQQGCSVVNTCSNSNKGWQRDLSPFILGPCSMYGNHQALVMENAWQFSKVYDQHVGDDGWPNQAWHKWSQKGWADTKAHRYPMGKGSRPKYSYWEVDGEPRKMLYIEARKAIYAPLYIRAVSTTNGFQQLKTEYNNNKLLVLRDFDGWDYTKAGLTLTQVLNLPNRIMGHACVLSMLLQNDAALTQLFLSVI